VRILYHLPLSPFCRKVRLALAEKRLPFEPMMERVWDRRPEFDAMNPACTVPVLLEENGLSVADSYAICEYLDEAYPDISLFGATLAERAEVRRLVSWFDLKFGAEVTANLYGEKYLKRQLGHGSADAALLRAGYANMKPHMEYLGWLAEARPWIGGSELSLADFAAAAHVSTLDFMGEVDWGKYPAVKDWYARLKSRPAFRPLLADRVSGINPPPHYADLDF
jgi:glutathione S-transferase